MSTESGNFSEGPKCQDPSLCKEINRCWYAFLIDNELISAKHGLDNVLVEIYDATTCENPQVEEKKTEAQPYVDKSENATQ